MVTDVKKIVLSLDVYDHNVAEVWKRFCGMSPHYSTICHRNALPKNVSGNLLWNSKTVWKIDVIHKQRRKKKWKCNQNVGSLCFFGWNRKTKKKKSFCADDVMWRPLFKIKMLHCVLINKKKIPYFVFSESFLGYLFWS